jgi:hypothetical protein
MWAPAGTPGEIVHRLNAVCAEVTRELAGA